jgi:hypothetical protein
MEAKELSRQITNLLNQYGSSHILFNPTMEHARNRFLGRVQNDSQPYVKPKTNNHESKY